MTTKSWLKEFSAGVWKEMKVPRNYIPGPFQVGLWILLGFGLTYGSLNPIANLSTAIHELHASLEHRAAWAFCHPDNEDDRLTRMRACP